jgi:hypothetical protein
MTFWRKNLMSGKNVLILTVNCKSINTVYHENELKI